MLQSTEKLIKNRLYMIVLTLTALLSYGYLITHSAIGIDDTPYKYYFEDGLAAIVGRWVLFLLNKVIHVAEYVPFITDLAGVLILMLAVTVWSAFFMDLFRNKKPFVDHETMSTWASIAFSCVFLSCPLISEVYTYHLHNGISIGYLCVGTSLWTFRKICQRLSAPQRESSTFPLLLQGLLSSCLLCIAIGCYESMMIVWLVGICLFLLTERYTDHKGGLLKNLIAAAILSAFGMLLRSIMMRLVIFFFHLSSMKEEAVTRSLSELFSWITDADAKANFFMVLKRIFVMYGVFAYAYYPIRIFVISVCFLFLAAILFSILKKDPWIMLTTIFAVIASFLLIFIEGKATLYRSAQFLPVICGYAALLFFWSCFLFLQYCKTGILAKHPRISKILYALPSLFLCVILWNQCADMTQWFYIDYVKYENAKECATQIYYRLAEGFDTSKPVVFTNTYTIPSSINEKAYVKYNTPTYYKMQSITSKIDDHLLDKFFRPEGVWVAQTPALSVIDWARYAFGDDSEMIKFFSMLGYQLTPLKNRDYSSIEEYSLLLPHFPEEGSIQDMGDYIIVNF